MEIWRKNGSESEGLDQWFIGQIENGFLNYYNSNFVRIVLVTIIARDVSERRHTMSFIKKNCTIVVLVAIIISALSLNALAVNEIIDWSDFSMINVLDKWVRGAAPQTEEAYFRTSSETYEHMAYAEIGCFECDLWRHDYSDPHKETPDSASAYVTFPWECWTGSSDHMSAGFDIVFCD